MMAECGVQCDRVMAVPLMVPADAIHNLGLARIKYMYRPRGKRMICTMASFTHVPANG